MHGLVCAATVGKEYTFAELVTLGREEGLFERLLSTTTADSELDPKNRSIVGNLFRRYARRLFTDGERRLVFKVDGKGHKRVFFISQE